MTMVICNTAELSLNLIELPIPKPRNPRSPDLEPALSEHGLEDFDLQGKAFGLSRVGPVVAALPGFLAADERPTGEREVEGEGARNAMRHFDRQVFEIGSLPAETLATVLRGEHHTPLICLEDQKTGFRAVDLDAVGRQVRLPGEDQVVFPHPDPHSNASVEAHGRLPGPVGIEADASGAVGEARAVDRFEGPAGDAPLSLGGIDVQAHDGEQIHPKIRRADADRADAPAAGEQPERAGVPTVRVYVRAVAVGAEPALIGHALFLGEPGAVELDVEVTLDQGGQ